MLLSIRLHPNLWKNIVLGLFVAILVCLLSCSNQPTDSQLSAWRQEAMARNQELLAANNRNLKSDKWSLLIQGEPITGKPIELNWQQLQSMATSRLKTIDANYAIQPKQIFDFRGITVSKLLQQLDIHSNITDITFVCFDSYIVTVAFEDLVKYPITLALERNGKPIKRDEGGPLYLVFPYTQYPEIKKIYTESKWAFYVTHMLIGTESVKLHVGKQQLDLNALDELPQVTLDTTVGLQVRWTVEKVKLYGVQLRDVLNLEYLKLPLQTNILVRGKAAIDRDK